MVSKSLSSRDRESAAIDKHRAMDLKVPQLQTTGMGGHSINGTLSMFIGHGVFLTAVENIKTNTQLRSKSKIRKYELPAVIYGAGTSFFKSFLQMGAGIAGNIYFDDLIEDKLNWFPTAFRGSVGVLFGVVLSYPFDTVRTRQGLTAYAGPLEIRNRNCTIISECSHFGIRDVYRGFSTGVLHAVFQQICAKGKNMCNICDREVLQGVVNRLVGSFSWLENKLHDHSLHDRIVWTVSLMLAKMLLTPLEIAKKRQQAKLNYYGSSHNSVINNDSEESESTLTTLRSIYKQEGITGLYKGWYLAVPESIATVLVTHVAFKVLARVFGE